MALNPDISALHDRLIPFDTLNPPHGYWIEGDETGDPTDMDYCLGCGADFVARLNLYTPGNEEFRLACTDPCGNNDTIPRCAECGKTLAGWPTDYCRSDLLRYFDGDDPDPTPEDVHVISMVLWNLQWSEGKDDVAAWREVAEKFVAKLPVLAPAN